MKSHSEVLKSRIKFLSIVVMVLGAIVVGRLFQLQILEKEKYREKADRLHFSGGLSVFDRGNIYFTTKDGESVSAAVVKDGYKIVVNPSIVENKERVYELVGGYTDADSFALFSDLYLEDSKRYSEIATELSYESVEGLLKDTELPIGLRVEKIKWRYYPGGDSAAQTIGFVAFNDDVLDGRYGIERYYEDVLARGDAAKKNNFFTELFAPKSELGSYDSGDLYLTIEPKLQSYLENTLLGINSKWSSQATGGIIVDPNTGEILAISVIPSFDLNDFESVEYTSTYANPFSERVYELGSVIKPIFIAAGLETNVIDEDTTFYDSGSIQVEDKTVYNFDKKGRGTVTVQTVLGESLNTGMVEIARRIGKNDIRKYVYGLGLDKKTGVDLPNETKGLLRNLESPRELEFATASFGQGIAITPLEAVKAFSGLINGGYGITPHLGKRVVYIDGTEEELIFEKEKLPVISEETSARIKTMLVNNVDDYYKNKPSSLLSYGVGAKTGTAQIPNPVDGGYYDDRNMHSFFGFFPEENPEYLVFLYTIHPKGVRYAAQTLLPPFMQIAEFTTSYYDVPPDR